MIRESWNKRENNMYTSAYYPSSAPLHAKDGVAHYTGDLSSRMNGLASLEGPSYCVRLWVFSMEGVD